MKKIILLFFIIVNLFTVSNPIAEQRMDKCNWYGTSGKVEDSSGNGYDATAKNGLNTDRGYICRAGKFDGV